MSLNIKQLLTKLYTMCNQKIKKQTAKALTGQLVVQRLRKGGRLNGGNLKFPKKQSNDRELLAFVQ